MLTGRRRREQRGPGGDPRKHSIGYVVRGAGGHHPGSAHVRVIRRLELDERPRVAYSQVDPIRFSAGEDPESYDVVLVQRDAVPGVLVDRFVQEIDSRGASLVVELDDDLVTDDARARLIAGGYAPSDLNGLRELISASTRVVVSTPTLADRLTSVHADVVIVPNALDPALWDSRVKADKRPRNDEYSVLYMGSATHVADLHLLRPVFDDLRSPDGRRIVLEVIGVTHHDEEWFRRIPMPDGTGNYPEFVGWLRRLAPRWSAGVAPLEDSYFNQAKSDLKFLEYTMLGLPTIASAVAPYANLPEHGGRIVTSVPEWRAALIESAARPGRARRDARRARRYVRAQRLIGHSGWDGILS